MAPLYLVSTVTTREGKKVPSTFMVMEITPFLLAWLEEGRGNFYFPRARGRFDLVRVTDDTCYLISDTLRRASEGWVAIPENLNPLILLDNGCDLLYSGLRTIRLFDGKCTLGSSKTAPWFSDVISLPDLRFVAHALFPQEF